MTSPEYSPDTHVSAQAGERTKTGGKRLRRFYFFLAALWGFGTGAVAVAAAAKFAGFPLGISRGLLAVLVASVPVALFGGFVAAEAYREARRRLR